MAVNCQGPLTRETTDITTIQSGQTYSGTFTNPFQAYYYQYEMTGPETMDFELLLSPGVLFDIKLDLYIYDPAGNTLTPVGTSFCERPINIFSYDGTPVIYRFCITPISIQGTVNFDLTVDFTEFDVSLLGEAIGAYGDRLLTFNFAPRPPQDCFKEVFYRFVDGDLPTGITVSSNLIQGVIPEMDCENFNLDREPSFSQFRQDEETGRWFPVTFDYIFTMEAYFPDDPRNGVPREFKICVVNNWTKDRDGYLQNSPDMLTQDFINAGDQVFSENDFGPEGDEVKEEESVPNEGTAIDSGLLVINNNELCELCPVEELEDPLPIDFDKELCEPCDIVEETGLVELPKTLCPCDIQPVIIEPQRDLIFGQLWDCHDDYIKNMYTKKACLIHECPDKKSAYPPILDDIVQFPNLCTPCEDE